MTLGRRGRGPLLPVFCLATLAALPASAQLRPLPSHRNDAPTRATSTVVARVNGVAIRSEELKVAIEARLPLASYHRNISPDALAQVRRDALDGLIDEELKFQEAVRLKVRVPPADVELALARAYESYKGREAFERAMRASGATMPQVRSSIMRALMIQQVHDQAVGSTCRVTEADASAYYNDNRARFVVPEEMHPFLITIAVDPSASRKEWDDARQKADAIARRIAAGESFETLAREQSSDSSKTQGGDLGFVHRGRLIDEIESALKKLRPGEVSGLVQTIYGFHLVRLAEIRPPTQKPFAEVKAQLVRDLTEKRCSEATTAWSRRLRAAARVQIFDGATTAARAAGDASY